MSDGAVLAVASFVFAVVPLVATTIIERKRDERRRTEQEQRRARQQALDAFRIEVYAEQARQRIERYGR